MKFREFSQLYVATDGFLFLMTYTPRPAMIAETFHSQESCAAAGKQAKEEFEKMQQTMMVRFVCVKK